MTVDVAELRGLLNCYPPHGLNAHLVTMYSMARDKLTPLGLAVRAHLENSNGG